MSTVPFAHVASINNNNIITLQNWQHINLTDIEVLVTSSEQHRNVILKFQLDVAQDWKARFDREKHKCSAIAHTIPTEQYTLSAV